MPRRKPRDPLTEMGYLRQETARCVEDCLAMARNLGLELSRAQVMARVRELLTVPSVTVYE